MRKGLKNTGEGGLCWLKKRDRNSRRVKRRSALKKKGRKRYNEIK